MQTKLEDLGTDGMANSPTVHLHMNQLHKNPLVNNKGFVRSLTIKQRPKEPDGAIAESLIPTMRNVKPHIINMSLYKKFKSLSIADEPDEHKFIPPAKPSPATCAKDPSKVVPPTLYTKSEDTTMPSARGTKYGSLRTTLTPAECLKQLFGDPVYRSELASVLQPLPQHTLQAYKYRLEAFDHDLCAKYAKDLAVYSGKKTLCLGLKDVLMAISSFAADNADAVLPVGTTGDMSLFLRPFLFEFLEDMRTKFELVLYSSLRPDQVNAIMEYLQKKKKYFDHYFDEKFCLFANVSYSIKCVDFLLENRSPEQIIVIDNSVKAFPLGPDNVVPISRFDGNPQDDGLVKLAVALDAIAKEPDVRDAIRKFRCEAEPALV